MNFNDLYDMANTCMESKTELKITANKGIIHTEAKSDIEDESIKDLFSSFIVMQALADWFAYKIASKDDLDDIDGTVEANAVFVKSIFSQMCKARIQSLLEETESEVTNNG